MKQRFDEAFSMADVSLHLLCVKHSHYLHCDWTKNSHWCCAHHHLTLHSVKQQTGPVRNGVCVCVCVCVRVGMLVRAPACVCVHAQKTMLMFAL